MQRGRTFQRTKPLSVKIPSPGRFPDTGGPIPNPRVDVRSKPKGASKRDYGKKLKPENFTKVGFDVAGMDGES